MDSEPFYRLLTIKQIVFLTGLSQSTIRRLIKGGKFPKPLRVARRAKRWRESAIKVWIDGLDASEGET